MDGHIPLQFAQVAKGATRRERSESTGHPGLGPRTEYAPPGCIEVLQSGSGSIKVQAREWGCKVWCAWPHRPSNVNKWGVGVRRGRAALGRLGVQAHEARAHTFQPMQGPNSWANVHSPPAVLLLVVDCTYCMQMPAVREAAHGHMEGLCPWHQRPAYTACNTRRVCAP